MSKMSKAIAVLGVVAGLGVAAMPLSSYATVSSNPETTIQAEVKRSLAIAVEDAEGTNLMGGTLDLGELTVNGAANEKALNVIVYSNNAGETYDLTISPAVENKVNMETTDGANNIPAAATFGNGTAGWGFHGGDIENYTALLPAGNTLVSGGAVTALESNETIGSETYTHGKTTEVTFGAAANSSTAEGTYTVKVSFTATDAATN